MYPTRSAALSFTETSAMTSVREWDEDEMRDVQQPDGEVIKCATVTPPVTHATRLLAQIGA